MQALTIRRPDFEQAALKLIETRSSSHTRAAYRSDLERWLRFCYALPADPGEASVEVATAFREHLKANLSAASARRVLSALSFVYRRLLGARVATSNPFHPAILAWPPAPRIGKTVAVTDQEVQALLAAARADDVPARGLRDAALLHILYDTGLRRASVVQIKRAAFSQQGGRTIARVLVKGAHEAEVVMPESTMQAINAWLAVAPPSPFLFPGRKGCLHVDAVNKILESRAREAGLSHIHPHSFRAAFVTAAYDAGLAEHEIQAAVHHTDPKTTRRYDRGQRGQDVTAAVAKRRGAL